MFQAINDAAIQSLVELPTELLNEPALLGCPEGGSLTKDMLISWASRPDLQSAFDLHTADGRQGLRSWCHRQGAGSSIRRLLRRGAQLSRQATMKGSQERALGVNLIGYVEGILGMGEHVRMAAQAMKSAKIPAGGMNFTLGLGNRRQPVDLGIPRLRRPVHRCNLFHINADEMVRTYWHLGPDFFNGHYNIGYWAWELARWPAEWRPLIGLVDEIWAPSRFVRDSLAPETQKPVEWMPLCIEIPNATKRRRSEFGLNDSEYVFLFSFDCHSYLERKNPFAVVRAFKAAFPAAMPARLVVKAMNTDVCRDGWNMLEREASSDRRINLIKDTWPREQMLALLDACDAYVSLHRSEGFGRGPAEAMLLGKPVIVTDYSGTADFCRKDNALLVDYSLVDVNPGSYVHSAGQVWADPSVERAAQHMRSLFDDRTLGPRVGANGRRTISKEFSASAIGQRYRARLVELGVV